MRYTFFSKYCITSKGYVTAVIQHFSPFIMTHFLMSASFPKHSFPLTCWSATQWKFQISFFVCFCLFCFSFWKPKEIWHALHDSQAWSFPFVRHFIFVADNNSGSASCRPSPLLFCTSSLLSSLSLFHWSNCYLDWATCTYFAQNSSIVPVMACNLYSCDKKNYPWIHNLMNDFLKLDILISCEINKKKPRKPCVGCILNRNLIYSTDRVKVEWCIL